MKTLLILLFFMTHCALYAQELTYEEFKSVIPFMQNEDYKGAFEKTKELLDKNKSDTSEIRAQISYMNIYSAAGMVILDQMSHKEFEENAKQFIGQKLKMPGHPCVDSTENAWNSFQFIYNEGELQGFTMTANKKKVNILLFEYYKLNDVYNPADFIGQNVRCGGVLESFEVNPNKSKIWICRLHISNSYVRGFIPR